MSTKNQTNRVEYSALYYKTNKKKILVRHKKYRETHKKERSEYQKKYREKNRDSNLKHQKDYRNKRNDEGKTILGWVRIKYDGTPCMDCGGVFKFIAMDFDHRLDETKSFAVSTMNYYCATTENLATVSKEIAKCDLICSNCHRVRTEERYK